MQLKYIPQIQQNQRTTHSVFQFERSDSKANSKLLLPVLRTKPSYCTECLISFKLYRYVQIILVTVMVEYWKFKTQSYFDSKINKPSLLDITFLNFMYQWDTVLSENNAIYWNNFYSENINPKLSANNLEIYYIYLSVFRKDNTDFCFNKSQLNLPKVF